MQKGNQLFPVQVVKAQDTTEGGQGFALLIPRTGGAFISNLNSKFYFFNGLRLKLLINTTGTLKPQVYSCIFKTRGHLNGIK